MNSMRALVIVGAGGLGREVWHICQAAKSAGTLAAPVLGFTDAQSTALKDRRIDATVLGDIEDLDWNSGLGAVIAVGDPATRAALRARVLAAGGSEVSVVHPSAVVHAGASVGAGCVVAPFAHISCDTTVADSVVVNVYALVGHDATVGECSVLSPYAAVCGDVTIGERVLLGTHSVVNPGLTVGRGSRVGSGAVITRDVPPLSLAAGVPATSRVMYVD